MALSTLNVAHALLGEVPGPAQVAQGAVDSASTGGWTWSSALQAAGQVATSLAPVVESLIPVQQRATFRMETMPQPAQTYIPLEPTTPAIPSWLKWALGIGTAVLLGPQILKALR